MEGMSTMLRCLLLASLIIPLLTNPISYLYTEYPELDDIPIVKVRKLNSSTEVTSGWLHLVGLKPQNVSFFKRFSAAEFKRLLQCPASEPGLNGDNGAISLMKLVPPTREIVELICAWDETKCRNWPECQPIRQRFRDGDYPKKMAVRQFDGSSLLRVINGTLYDDWPWGIDRLEKEHPHERILLRVLSRVNDVKDSVFLKGVEVPYFPFNFPFPFLHVAPKEGTNHIAWPWPNSYKYAIDAYPNTVVPEADLGWGNRKPKAAFFSTYSNIRRMIYDQALARPDLFEIGMTMIAGNEIVPWDPSAKDYMHWRGHENYKPPANGTILPGTAGAVVPFINSKQYNPREYKYNIVMSGLNGQSGADRLAKLLSQSGAVVLMQKTSFSYHFMDRLKPWVHYVPLGYSGADAIEKIEWLQQHDDVARRISLNAQAFARSHLRLEDYYCYAATALEALGSVFENTDATKPFHPRKLSQNGRAE